LPHCSQGEQSRTIPASRLWFAAHRRMWQCSINTMLCIDATFQDHMIVIVDDDCAMQTAPQMQIAPQAAESNPGCEQ
jgi:hypothetical protein